MFVWLAKGRARRGCSLLEIPNVPLPGEAQGVCRRDLVAGHRIHDSIPSYSSVSEMNGTGIERLKMKVCAPALLSTEKSQK